MERLRWKKMTREFDCIEDIEEYYDEKSNTYVFMDDGRYIDLIIFNFNLFGTKLIQLSYYKNNQAKSAKKITIFK